MNLRQPKKLYLCRAGRVAILAAVEAKADSPDGPWVKLAGNPVLRPSEDGSASDSWPGHIPAGQVVDQPVHAIDWYPTLVNLAGGSLKQSLPLDGKDIWRVLVDGAKSPHDALLLSGTSFGTAAVRVGDWKLLYGQNDKKGKMQNASNSPEEYQLYNLVSDIGEKNNLAASNPVKLAEMKEVFQRLLKDAVPSLSPEKLETDAHE